MSPTDRPQVNVGSAPPAYDYLHLSATEKPLTEKNSEYPAVDKLLRVVAELLDSEPPEPIELASSKSFELKSLRKSDRRPLRSNFEGTASWRTSMKDKLEQGVTDILEEIMKHLIPDSSIHSVLGKCSQALEKFDSSLSRLLQSRCIRHTFLYWVVWKHHNSSANDSVIDTFLALAAPLEDQTALDVKAACLHTANHTLFDRLRRSRIIATSTDPDESLLGLLSADSIHFKEGTLQDAFDFTVRLSMPDFQARLKAMRCISLELIARDDGWRDGWWIVKVSTGGTSPYVRFESQLVFLHGRSESSLPVTMSTPEDCGLISQNSRCDSDGDMNYVLSDNAFCALQDNIGAFDTSDKPRALEAEWTVKIVTVTNVCTNYADSDILSSEGDEEPDLDTCE
ncbi:uncharacterized protein LAESUDRAFT_717487 [Laetiporus sulphureus 93-53]|uniref:Uncharacterized protein n=1 Tax=Laetiporus sulphureus 93-53 TaxID=1314785 RepID=A0A165BQR0_9APHY|nr:uncharacterized protein LAESUDRAFT_717487 [Laetiporus sulphureus 93-53]KZT01481.1 hypothetical protein LAESUDRAFT_717487 [Laetiporus sulphureus 93-53]